MLMRCFIVLILLLFSLPSACLFLSSTPTYASLNAQERSTSLSDEEKEQKKIAVRLKLARQALEKAELSSLSVNEIEGWLNKAAAILKPLSASNNTARLLCGDLHYQRWQLYAAPSKKKFSQENLRHLAEDLACCEFFFPLADQQLEKSKLKDHAAQKLENTQQTANRLIKSLSPPELGAIVANTYAQKGLHDRAYYFLEQMAERGSEVIHFELALLHLKGSAEEYAFSLPEEKRSLSQAVKHLHSVARSKKQRFEEGETYYLAHEAYRLSKQLPFQEKIAILRQCIANPLLQDLSLVKNIKMRLKLARLLMQKSEGASSSRPTDLKEAHKLLKAITQLPLTDLNKPLIGDACMLIAESDSPFNSEERKKYSQKKPYIKQALEIFESLDSLRTPEAQLMYIVICSLLREDLDEAYKVLERYKPRLNSLPAEWRYQHEIFVNYVLGYAEAEPYNNIAIDSLPDHQRSLLKRSFMSLEKCFKLFDLHQEEFNFGPELQKCATVSRRIIGANALAGIEELSHYSEEKAIALLQQACEEGDPDATLFLLLHYLLNEKERDSDKIQAYKEMAQLNDADVKGICLALLEDRSFWTRDQKFLELEHLLTSTLITPQEYQTHREKLEREQRALEDKAERENDLNNSERDEYSRRHFYARILNEVNKAKGKPEQQVDPFQTLQDAIERPSLLRQNAEFEIPPIKAEEIFNRQQIKTFEQLMSPEGESLKWFKVQAMLMSLNTSPLLPQGTCYRYHISKNVNRTISCTLDGRTVRRNFHAPHRREGTIGGAYAEQLREIFLKLGIRNTSNEG